MTECLHPDLAGTTSYARGCRCERCRGEVLEVKRAYRERHRERLAEVTRSYREQHPDVVRDQWRQYDAAHRESRAEAARRRRDADPEPSREAVRRYTSRLDSWPIVRRPYTAADDAIIRAWTGTSVDLARSLARSLQSVASRRRALGR